MTLTSPLHLAFWFDAHLTYPAHFPDRGLAHILQQLAPFQTCCWMAPLHTCTLSSPVPTQLLNVDVPGLLTIICTLEPLAFLFDAAGLIYLNVFVPTAPTTYQLACPFVRRSDLPPLVSTCDATLFHAHLLHTFCTRPLHVLSCSLAWGKHGFHHPFIHQSISFLVHSEP